MSKEWYVKTKKGVTGPISSAKLRELVAAGKIKPASAISPDGEKWAKAGDIKGLEFPVPEDDPLGLGDDPLGLGGAQIEIPPAPTAGFVAQREAGYVERFGPYSEVHHELQPIVPHIDVYVHPPHGDRDFTTLVTGGMSDNPMPVPPGACSPRAELLLYVDEPKQEYVELLRFVAQLPYKQQTWYSYGSTMTNGQPPQPIFDGSVLDCYLFLMPIIESDFEICEAVTIVDSPLQLLWVTPVTSAERQLVMDKGIDAFFPLLNKYDHPLVAAPSRKCYVNRKGWFGR